MNRIIFFAALVALVSCRKDTDEMHLHHDSDEIRFEISMNATRASATEFEAGDGVALYAVEYVSDTVPELQIAGNFINNEKLTFNGSQWLADNTLYWSDKPCDFYALYPYMNLNSVEENAFELMTDQNSLVPGAGMDGYEACDLLWAKAEKVARADGSVNLKFKHMMSKCVVTLTKGAKFDGDIPDDVVCHVYNTTTSAKIDFAKGSVERDNTGQRKTIMMRKLTNQHFEAVIVPQNIERRTPLIEVTMGGIAYLLEYSLSFKPGYVHTINLILNTSPDQEKVEISIDAGTEDWN